MFVVWGESQREGAEEACLVMHYPKLLPRSLGLHPFRCRLAC